MNSLLENDEIKPIIAKLIYGDKDAKVVRDDAKKLYVNLVHYFLTEKVTTKELLAGSKWESDKSDVYDPIGKRFGNFVGIIESEPVDISKDFASELKYQKTGKMKIKPIRLKLQIISRFDSVKKPYFLQTMLAHGKNLHLTDNDITSSEDGYFDFLLMALFKWRFLDAAGKGYYKTYHEFQGNDSAPRGRIDIARHIKLNIGQKNGKIAYSYRENSLVNYLNMLILEAYRYLESKYFSLSAAILDSEYELVRMIEEIKYATENYMCDINTVISKNLTPISHPYYTEYEALRQVCLKIMRNEGMGYEDASAQTQGILYYMPDLWEEYLQDRLEGSEYRLEAQCEENIFSYSYDDGIKFSTNTRPDFVFFNKDTRQPFMILDAKFKPVWWKRIIGKNSLGEIEKCSLMGDYDKCIRDMNSINAHSTGVIFPAHDDSEAASEYRNAYEKNSAHNISEYNTRDRFYTFPVFVSKCEKYSEYNDWFSAFEQNNGEIWEAIRETVREAVKRQNSK